MPIVYLVLSIQDSEIVCVPGFFERATRRFYPWDDVLLTRHNVPEWGELLFTPRIDFVFQGVRIEGAVEPPTAVTTQEVNGTTVVRVGYWDATAGVFLAWKGVAVSEAQWTAYLQRSQEDGRDWTRVSADAIHYFSGIAVPRGHAPLAMMVAAAGEPDGPLNIQVAPDIEVHAPIELRRE